LGRRAAGMPRSSWASSSTSSDSGPRSRESCARPAPRSRARRGGWPLLKRANGRCQGRQAWRARSEAALRTYNADPQRAAPGQDLLPGSPASALSVHSAVLAMLTAAGLDLSQDHLLDRLLEGSYKEGITLWGSGAGALPEGTNLGRRVVMCQLEHALSAVIEAVPHVCSLEKPGADCLSSNDLRAWQSVPRAA
jgi:hypothetical protein